MTQHSKHTKAAKAYHAWKQDLQKLRFDVPSFGAQIVFHMPMPKSWSKKKRANHRGGAHMSKPDIDNLVKAALDAARYGKGDHDIWQISAMKIWDEEGFIEVKRVLIT